MRTNIAGLRRGTGFKKYRPIKLVPRGALQRPVGAHLSIEIFNEMPDQYPAVHITAEAHGKIRALVDAASPLEVLWLSPAKVTPNGDVVVYDVLVPHQECTSGSTRKLESADLDGEDRLLSDLVTARKFDVIRDLICWGHSHVNSGTYPSGVDEAQTRDYVKRMQEMGKTRFVRLIANRGDDLSASLYLIDEKKVIHHAPIKAEPPPDATVWRAWARGEVRKKVTKEVIVLPEYKEFDWEGFYKQYPHLNETLLDCTPAPVDDPLTRKIQKGISWTHKPQK